MASELNVLAHALNRFSERSRYCRDFTLNSLTLVLREIIACFPVYRTYVNAREPVSDRDRDYIERATFEAKRRNPRQPAFVFDFVRDLLVKGADYIGDAEREEQMRFVGKFQQVTSPVTAKGIEDTALYVYNRLTSLNEVGSQPDRFGVSPDALHAWLAGRAARWPNGLSASSTHDAKRSEDVRARLNVLSELPGAWKQSISALGAHQWARPVGSRRTVVPEPQRGVPPLPDATRHVATCRHDVRGRMPIPRTHRRLHAQGDARGEDIHQLAQSEPDARAGDGALRRIRARAGQHRIQKRVPAVPPAHRPIRAVQLARAADGEDRRARCPRFLPGNRAVGLQPGRPGQSASGRLRAPSRLAPRTRRGTASGRAPPRWRNASLRIRATTARSCS